MKKIVTEKSYWLNVMVIPYLCMNIPHQNCFKVLLKMKDKD